MRMGYRAAIGGKGRSKSAQPKREPLHNEAVAAAKPRNGQVRIMFKTSRKGATAPVPRDTTIRKGDTVYVNSQNVIIGVVPGYCS